MHCKETLSWYSTAWLNWITGCKQIRWRFLHLKYSTEKVYNQLIQCVHVWLWNYCDRRKVEALKEKSVFSQFIDLHVDVEQCMKTLNSYCIKTTSSVLWSEAETNMNQCLSNFKERNTQQACFIWAWRILHLLHITINRTSHTRVCTENWE